MQAGLNFASEDEAVNFKKAVETKLQERHQRKMGIILANSSVIYECVCVHAYECVVGSM